MKRPKEKDLDLGRFRLEVYAAGTCDLRGRGFFSAEDHAVYRAAHFPSAEAAVAAFLDDLWDWTADPDIPEPERIPETLLANTAVVVDRARHRTAALVAFRWPELGESRLPVAMIVNLPSGEVSVQAVEQHQAAEKSA
ncbi:MAG: hypothetical protein ACLQLG_05140 [Thermoguttaceae bacterium]